MPKKTKTWEQNVALRLHRVSHLKKFFNRIFFKLNKKVMKEAMLDKRLLLLIHFGLRVFELAIC